MDELICGVWEVIVDNVLHLGNIQPSSGDSSGHEDLKSALSEVCQGLLPLPLCSVPVDAGR